MAEGFFGRWSQRKQALRAGQPLTDAAPPAAQPGTPAGAAGARANSAPAAPVSAGASANSSANALASAPVSASVPSTDAQTLPQPLPAPTLDDVQALKSGDSFARFVAGDVASDVRNAAMKKLFADPHYKVIDGMDIYLDDYNRLGSLDVATVRQMVSGKFLNLFGQDLPPADVPGAPPIGEDAHTATPPSVAQCADEPVLPGTPVALPIEPVPPTATVDLLEITAHDDLDLRLQPDHAARRARLEREPERDPDAALKPVPPRSG